MVHGAVGAQRVGPDFPSHQEKITFCTFINTSGCLEKLASLEGNRDQSRRALIHLTIPTPSNVKMAVPKNSRKVFQLAIKGRLLGSGIS